MKKTNSLKTVVFAIIKLRKTISGPSGIQNLHYYITGYTKKRRPLWKTAKLFMEEGRQFNTDQFNEINKENKVYGAY